jgi:hypothetical protein
MKYKPLWHMAENGGNGGPLQAGMFEHISWAIDDGR